jgi:hypothetical protein
VIPNRVSANSRAVRRDKVLRDCNRFLPVLTFVSIIHFFLKHEINITSQLLAMDVSAQVTMKDAAKCDKRCEWQNSANQENVERILHFQVILGSMSSSGLLAYHVASDAGCNTSVSWYTFLCASDE